MKKILFIILSPVIIFAQTAWYVDTERTGAGTYNGTSWATAWNLTNSVDYWGTNSTGIVWSSIGAGDTIFFSGGTDTVFIDAEGAYGTVFRWSGTSDFSAGNPLIITEGKYSSNPTGHDGEVVFRNVTDKQNTLWIRQIINFKLVGITVTTTSPHTALQIGTGNYPPEDSMMTVQNCDIIGVGLAGLIGTTSNYVSILDNRIETFENAYPNDQDPMGFNTGLGHIVDGNTIICANDYETITDTNLMDAGGMSVDEVSLTDADLNMVTNYHVGNSVWVNGYYLQITSNTDDTFTGAEWLFDPIVQNNGTAVIITSTSLQDNNTESHNAGTLVGAVIEAANGSKLLITSNSGTSFTGSAGWVGEQPSNGTTYVIGGGDAPLPNLPWTMGGAHRDIIQISNLAPNAGNYFIFSNNLVIDTKEGGSGWNNIVYNYSDLATPHISLVFYNNIIVSRKNITSPSLFALGSNYGEEGYTRWNSVKILQNTLMIKGEANGGAFLVSWAVDSVIVKNNLIVLDTTSEYFYSPENSSGLWTSVIKDIDYNVYAKYGGIIGSTQFGSSNLASPDWDAWRNYDNYDGSGVDSNSVTYNSTAVAFEEKYGLDIADYYTGVGRDAGENLLSAYPFLRYDILGHERGYGSGWDIGALEYIGGATPIDSTPVFSLSLTDVSNAELNTQYFAQTGDLTDFDSAYARVDVGEYNINGGTWKNSSQWTLVHENDDVYLRYTTGSTYDSVASITLTVGTTSDTWLITTKSAPVTSGSGFILKGSDGSAFRMSNGKIFRTADTTSTPPIEYDSIPPSAPVSFVAVGGSSQTQFQTTWSYGIEESDLAAIQYYEGSANDTTTMSLITTLGAVNSYLRTGRTANTLYWCAVKAVDDSGNVSYFSNVDSARTLTTPESGTPLSNLDLAYLTQSTGAHLYDHSLVADSGTTTMQAEMTAYNTANSSDGSITRINPDYPAIGDMIWDWNEVFFGGSRDGNTQNIITEYATNTYDILQVTFGFNSGDIWFPGWYSNEAADTSTYRLSHIENVYKYYIRNMVTAMELYPDKYWILWTIPPVTVGSSGGSADALRHANFNTWMVDTLQAGLDSYGAFPNNVYIFDVFTLLKDPSSNFMNPAFADGEEDSHSNADASSYIAPIYVNEVFNHARAYRIP